MKIIFLDIDGPLIRFTSNSNDFDADSLANLQDIINKTGAEIIISSDWKYDKPLLDGLFSKYNLKYIDTTEVINENEIPSGDMQLINLRRKEIKELLLDYKQKGIPVDKYVIIDDLDLKMNHFYKIDENVGLNNEISNKIIDYLNN